MIILKKWILTSVERAALCSLLIFCFQFICKAQNQSLYFEGTKGVEFFTSQGLPIGNCARTIEFWLKSDLDENMYKNYEPIIGLGEPGKTGSAFGISSRKINGKFQLCFWGNNKDQDNLAEIVDDNWHFVAITYNNSVLKCYVDGELKSAISLNSGLNTINNDNKVYLGGYTNTTWLHGKSYFKGAIDNLSIWDVERTQEQIQKAMVMQYENHQNLLVHFKFDEAGGTTFSNSLPQLAGTRNLTTTIPNESITGSLPVDQAVRFTNPIDLNFTMLSDGIWFVIQNKEELVSDYKMPARNLAIKASSNGSLSLDPIPMDGRYDEFLWRVFKDATGKYKLINKKHHDINEELLRGLLPGNNTISNLSAWQIELSNESLHGTNAYRLTFENKRLNLNNTVLSMATVDNSAKQIWLFQPMGVVGGYHIPNSPLTINSYDNQPTVISPFTRMLELDNNVKLYGSNTCSEWVILNHHLVANNVMNSTTPDKRQSIGEHPAARKEIVTFSKFDANHYSYNYPFVNEILDHQQLIPTNGGMAVYHNRQIFGWTAYVNEAITNGIYEKDLVYRGFDHLTHEFGHILAVDRDSDQYSTPEADFLQAAAERYAAGVSAFFNSNWSYPTAPHSRNEFKTAYPTVFDYIAITFDKNSSWYPPRTIRRPKLPHKIPTKIPSGTVIFKKGEQTKGIFPFQSDMGNNALLIGPDGNTTLTRIREGKYGNSNGPKYSFQDFNIPLNPEEIKFENGCLKYIYSNGDERFLGLSTPITNKQTFLVVTSDNSNQRRLKVIDEKGNTLREIDNFY